MKPNRYLWIGILLILVLALGAEALSPTYANGPDPTNGNANPPGPAETRIVHKWTPGKGCMENKIPIHAAANGWEEGPCKIVPTEEPTPVPTNKPDPVPTETPEPIFDLECSEDDCCEQMIELWEEENVLLTTRNTLLAEQNAILNRIAQALENE